MHTVRVLWRPLGKERRFPLLAGTVCRCRRRQGGREVRAGRTLTTSHDKPTEAAAGITSKKQKWSPSPACRHRCPCRGCRDRQRVLPTARRGGTAAHKDSSVATLGPSNSARSQT